MNELEHPAAQHARPVKSPERKSLVNVGSDVVTDVGAQRTGNCSCRVHGLVTVQADVKSWKTEVCNVLPACV